VGGGGRVWRARRPVGAADARHAAAAAGGGCDDAVADANVAGGGARDAHAGATTICHAAGYGNSQADRGGNDPGGDPISAATNANADARSHVGGY